MEIKERYFTFDSRDLEKALRDLRPETTRGDLDMLFDRIRGHEQLRKAKNINIKMGDCEIKYLSGAAKLIGG